MDIQVESAGATHVGLRRETNEDQFFIGEFNTSIKVLQTSIPIDDCSRVFGRTQGHLFLVADGLGGHASGERASSLVISAVCDFVLNKMRGLGKGLNDEERLECLKSIAKECHTVLVSSAREHFEERGMATTLTMALVVWPQLSVIHVGDSRCYLLREGRMNQLTEDHTLGQLYAQVTGGKPDESKSHVLWNTLSSESDAEPEADIVQQHLELQDQLLLCTDGVYGHLDNDALAQMLNTSKTAADACDAIVQRSLQRGGKDNITVVTARFYRPAPAEKIASAVVETRVPLEKIIDGAAPPTHPDDTGEFPEQALAP